MANEQFVPKTVECETIGARPVEKTMDDANEATANVQKAITNNMRGAVVKGLGSAQCLVEGAKGAAAEAVASADTTFADMAKEIAIERYSEAVTAAEKTVTAAEEALVAAQKALEAKQAEEAEAADSTENSTEAKAEGSEETTEEVSVKQEAVDNAQTALEEAQKALEEAQAELKAAKDTDAKEFVT